MTPDTLESIGQLPDHLPNSEAVQEAPYLFARPLSLPEYVFRPSSSQRPW